MAKIPIREKLFTEGTSGSLLGAKCKACGRVLAPLTTTCCHCRGEDLEEVGLSRQGKLYSYTVVYQPHPKFGVPYSVGLIELSEDGPRVFAPLKTKEGKQFKVGMEMELVIEKLWDENENEIIGPKFQPV
jgi:uncharacterized OB-fold protein